MNMNVKNGSRAKRKVWTAEDDEALRYWHAFKFTDGRIAKKLGCSRWTVLRQREAMGLRAVDHPGRDSTQPRVGSTLASKIGTEARK